MAAPLLTLPPIFAQAPDSATSFEQHCSDAPALVVSWKPAEAPKNYMTFDPEQKKLQALIQQKPTAALLVRARDTDQGPSSTPGVPAALIGQEIP
ncbi:hypothetical protein AURDEDRAFT_178597 [Auricularia subglabra TFB-10046 SS5]|uniref:Uncharacterized protein n=1 Tax=Auricularia subglabra (strain TFB-10046 / SS5) TaxID=717982 RepID=J0WJ80_AURST|nr:hypothetical protein AURDEDRAFT_178597 [Auricularia subglabra TFB-10046 SS5]